MESDDRSAASDDERGFILLCEAILEDGEVSAEEARGISEWLGDHPEVAGTWPASELIKSLQEIWADGWVDKRELHRLARLLVSLQREWAAPESRDVVTLPEVTAPEADQPGLPDLNARVQIPSWEEDGSPYQVDLSGPSCSCAEWLDRRANLPVGHLSRCCKHILAAYAQLPRTGKMPDWLEAFIEYGWPVDPKTKWELLTVEKEKVLISNAATKGWANVFAKEEGTYKRFGYKLDEHRWAYDAAPAWAWVIIDAVRSLHFGTS